MSNKQKEEHKSDISKSITDFDIKDLFAVEDSSSNPDADDLEAQERKRYAQDTRYRKLLALWVMWVVSIWLSAVLVVITLTGCKVLSYTPTVLVTLLATTTINVLGLAFIVLRGLFLGARRFKKRKNT